MAAASPKKPPGPRKSTDEGGVVEVDMTRLSKMILDTFDVDLDHNQLKKLGYRAEKRYTNPNTYYRLPGVTGSIENCPKVVKHIKKVVLQGKQAEIAVLLGKNAKPKLPLQLPKRQRASAGAAGAPPSAATSSGAAANIKAEESSEEVEESDEDMEDAPATAAAADGHMPAGWCKVDEAKSEKVMEGLAMYIQTHTELKSMKGADLKAKGVLAIEESRPLGPGERMRHAHVWWPGNMQEPLRCAQYIFAAKSFLELPDVRTALGLKALQTGKEAAPPAANARKRPSAAAESAPAPAVAAPVAPNSAPPAVKRTRRSMSDTAAEAGAAAAAGRIAPAAVAAAKTSPPAAAAGAGIRGSTLSLAERSRTQIKQEQAAAASGAAATTAVGGGAAASGGNAGAPHIPVSATDGAEAEAEAAAGDAKGAAAPSGKVRGPSGRFLSKSELAAAAAAGGSPAADTGSAAVSGRAAATASAAPARHSPGNQQVLDSVDDAVKLLQEALALGALLPPAVLNALPSVFTASLDGTLQDFLAQATAMREGLKADKDLLLNMAADYAAEITAAARNSKKSSSAVAESHYRRPYLAFRAALGVCAADAHTWLQDRTQREMIARLEGLVQIKKQLEDKKSEEDRLRQEQEQMRLQQEKLQEELRAYKERIKRLEEEDARRKVAAAAAAAAAEPVDAKPAAADQAA